VKTVENRWIELVAMAPSMVTVGNTFKCQGLYKFIRKIEYDVINKMEKGAACFRSLQPR
jgi:hypothetical protein